MSSFGLQESVSDVTYKRLDLFLIIKSLKFGLKVCQNVWDFANRDDYLMWLENDNRLGLLGIIKSL